jgi:hypothetical protein
MKWRLLTFVGMALLGVAQSWADTVTRKNHISVNGTLVGMADGQLKIIARYTSETKTLSIKMDQVEMIEFNGTTFNTSAPSKVVGLGPPLASDEPSVQSKTQDTNTIFLRGSHKSCTLVSIDEQSVQCAGKDGTYSRRVVIRIVTGGQ